MEVKQKSKNGKIIITLAVIAVIGIIATLVWGLFRMNGEIQALSFVEGRAVDNPNGKGGIVTVSKNWIVYEDDSFIKDSSVEKSTVEEIYCDLHQSNLMEASQKDLLKLSYSKTITIQENGNSRIFYLVGGYYVTFPDISKSKD